MKINKNEGTRRQKLGSHSIECESRKVRKLRKYSDNFNEIFSFFLKSYRSGILEFTGSIIDVELDVCGDEGKYCFRKIENGEIKRNEVIITRHPNITKAVVSGKRSWGLFVDQWSDGICDFCFTEEEILKEFKLRGIMIPECLLKDFYNRIDKKKMYRNKKYFELRNK